MRSFDRDGAIRADRRHVFMLLESELRVVNDPRLVIPHLKEQRIHFGAGSAAGA